jgi:hypothetical protein
MGIDRAWTSSCVAERQHWITSCRPWRQGFSALSVTLRVCVKTVPVLGMLYFVSDKMLCSSAHVRAVTNDLTRLYEAELATLQNDILSVANAEADVVVVEPSSGMFVVISKSLRLIICPDSNIRQLSFLVRLLEELVSWSSSGLVTSTSDRTEGRSLSYVSD